MYAYQGMPSSSVSDNDVDWASEACEGYRMSQDFTANSPYGEILVTCEKHDPEFGNPAWTIRYRRKDGSSLGRMSCLGSNPQNDRVIGLRHAADNLRKKQAVES